MSEYNGWTNYETWRVNLEVLDGMTPEDVGFRRNEFLDEDRRENFAERLGLVLEMYVCEVMEAGIENAFTLNLVHDFLSKVNWNEIAQCMVDDYIAEDRV